MGAKVLVADSVNKALQYLGRLALEMAKAEERDYKRAVLLAGGKNALAFVWWLYLWRGEPGLTKPRHRAWVGLLDETRRPGYDGELPVARSAR